MSTVTILQPYGPVRSTALFLGYFAPGDGPLRRQNGVYRMAGAGWFTQAYGELHGPYTRETEALYLLAELERRGPVGFHLAVDVGKRAGIILLKILAAVFCLVTLWLFMATV